MDNELDRAHKQLEQTHRKIVEDRGEYVSTERDLIVRARRRGGDVLRRHDDEETGLWEATLIWCLNPN